MIKKVYYNDKCVYLTNEWLKLDGVCGTFIFKPSDPSYVFLQIKHFLNSISSTSMIIKHDNVDELFEAFSSQFVCIDAAGGLVENANGDLLVISRRGWYDLPKGKRKKGETHEQNALREVAEETGLSDVTICSSLCQTYHIYLLDKDQYALKTTYWYKMKVDDCPILKPQIEEDIVSANWVSKSEMKELATRTYYSLREIFLSV